MANEPVDLDERRDIQVRKAIEIRRRLSEYQEDLASAKLHQSELENLLLVTPAKTWSEVAVKAVYLLQQFSSTPEAQDPRRQEIIGHTILELNHLRNRPQEKP